MESSEVILTIAGLALGLAGFSGVIVSLNPTQIGDWDPSTRFNFRILVQVAAVAAFFALLPFPIHVLFDSELAWRISLLIYGVFHAFDVGSFVLRFPKNISRMNHRMAIAGCVVAAVQIVVGVLGNATTMEATYLFVLIWHVSVAFMGFVMLVFGLGRGGAQEADAG